MFPESLLLKNVSLEAFQRETCWLATACRDNPPAPGVSAVRVPGQRGLEFKRRALVEGVELYPSILDSLTPFVEKYGLEKPKPIG